MWPVRLAAAMVVAVAGHAAGQSVAPVVEVRGDAVVFQGRIDGGSLAEFRHALEDSTLKRLVITSRGGLVASALELAALVHERHMDIEVPMACLSSCANYVFPAGRRKTIGHPGAVAWHGNMAHVLYLDQHGQGTWSAEQMAGARELAAREAEFFRSIGVDGFVCWFAKIAPYNVADFYYLSAADMERFGIRDVTLLDATAPPAPDEEFVAVDWARLEAQRRSVSLGE